jgi:hypothetical protein
MCTTIFRAARESCQPVEGWHHEPVRSLIAVAVAASLVLVACSTPTAPAASPSSGASPSSAGPAPRPAIATPGAATVPPPSQALVIPHDDPELERRLPDEVDGTTLTKFSVGPGSSASESDAQGMHDIALRIGDGSGEFGVAYAGDPANKFNLFAFRVDGADPSALATQFAQMTFAETVGGKVEAATLGGRDVVHVVDPVSEIGDVWFYADGDTLLGVQAGSTREATDLLALLQ